jgi:DNA-binding CsgD family transcriptional regulator
MADLGAALRRAGRRAESREILRPAFDLAHRCGALALTERTRTEPVAADVRPRRIVLGGLDSLTPSERRVAHLAAAGLSNRDIAQNLFITARTVEGHLTHAYQKLAITSREQLPAALPPPAARPPPRHSAERQSSSHAAGTSGHTLSHFRSACEVPTSARPVRCAMHRRLRGMMIGRYGAREWVICALSYSTRAIPPRACNRRSARLITKWTKSINAASRLMEYVKQCMDMRVSNARYSACAGLGRASLTGSGLVAMVRVLQECGGVVPAA